MLKLAEVLAPLLAEHAARDPELWLLDADLGDSYGLTNEVTRSFGPRFVQVGIAEQCMVSVAAGLAAMGKRPWVFSFAAFLCSRSHDQIRCGVSQMRLPVTLVGANAGIEGLKNGNTHLSLIDLGLIGSLTDIDIWSPHSEGDFDDSDHIRGERGPGGQWASWSRCASGESRFSSSM